MGLLASTGKRKNVNLHQVFNLLVEKREVSVRVGNKQEHENLRIRLVRYFSTHRRNLADIGYDGDETAVESMCSHYDKEKLVSTFTLRKRKPMSKEYDVILEPETAPKARADSETKASVSVLNSLFTTNAKTLP